MSSELDKDEELTFELGKAEVIMTLIGATWLSRDESFRVFSREWEERIWR